MLPLCKTLNGFVAGVLKIWLLAVLLVTAAPSATLAKPHGQLTGKSARASPLGSLAGDGMLEEPGCVNVYNYCVERLDLAGITFPVFDKLATTLAVVPLLGGRPHCPTKVLISCELVSKFVACANSLDVKRSCLLTTSRPHFFHALKKCSSSCRTDIGHTQ